MRKWLFLIPLTGLALLLAACGSLSSRPAAQAANLEPAEAPLPNISLTPELLYDVMLGEIALQRGELNVAVVTLNRAAQKTRDPRLVERATLVSLYAKRFPEAMEMARLWVSMQPNNPEAREALAGVLIESDQPLEAQQHLEKILAHTSSADVAQIYLRMAAALGRQQNRTAAMDVMQALVRLHPKLPEAHFALAHLAVRAGDLDIADSAIKQALVIRPDWEEAALFRTRILTSRKDVEEVLTFSEEFLGRHPRAASFRMNYARYLVEIKQWDKARQQFKKVADLSPDDPDALYAVGLLALQSNILEEAEIYLKRNLLLQEDNQQARLYLGQIAVQRKRYGEAARWYQEVSEGEHYFEAQARLGVVMAKQGDLDGARRHLQGLQPKTNAERVQRALTEEEILRDAKRYDLALKVLSQVIIDLPDNHDLLYARALVAEKLDMLTLHESDLRKILRADPKNAHALNALGYTLADRTNRHQEASKLIEQALAIKPDDPFIMDSMGWVQYRLGNYQLAVKYLKSALERSPDAEISAHLGEVLWVMGDRAGAESVWTRALQKTPDSEVLLGIIKKFKQ